MNRMFAPLLAASLMSAPAIAASLRPLTTLAAPVVRLSDLFDDAGPDAARVLGTAPAPGARILVEAPQLAAIARQFGVDWRPSSPSDRAVLDRPGTPLPRESVLAALREALTIAGAPADAEIDLPGFSAPLVPPEAQPHLAIEQFALDLATGRFSGTLAITAEGMAMLRVHLAGTSQEMVEVPVPVHRLLMGSVIRAADLQMMRVRAGLVRGEVVRSPEQAVGLAVRRQAMPGQPLLLSEIGRLAAVQKGMHVTMELHAPGLTLQAQGQALQSGGIGDTIQVLNPTSHAVVEAEVIASDRVRIAPGTIPMQQTGTQPNGGQPMQLAFIRNSEP
jgi:flagella basal body P-ring formation protein FlgA